MLAPAVNTIVDVPELNIILTLMHNLLFPPSNHLLRPLCVSPALTTHTQRRMCLAVCRMDSAIVTRTYGNLSLVASVCVTLELSCVTK